MLDAQAKPDDEPCMRLALGVLLLYAILTMVAFARLNNTGAVAPGWPMGDDRAAFLAVSAVTGTAFDLAIRRPVEYQPDAIAIVRGAGLCGFVLTMLAGGVLTACAIDRRSRAWIVIACGAAVVALAMLVGWLITGNGWLAAACVTGFGTLATGVPLVAHSPVTVLLYLPLMVLATLGPAVWGLLVLRRGRRFVVPALAWTCGVWLVATVILLSIQWTTRGGPMRGDTFTTLLSTAAVSSLDARVTGLEPTSIADMPRIARWVLTLLAMIGTNVGLSGLGIGVLAAWAMTAGRAAVVGRQLLAAWAGVWVVVAVIGVGWLAAVAPQLPFDQVLLLAISATSHVGLSSEPISLTGDALWALTWTMALAKVGQLLVLGMCCRPTRIAAV